VGAVSASIRSGQNLCAQLCQIFIVTAVISANATQLHVTHPTTVQASADQLDDLPEQPNPVQGPKSKKARTLAARSEAGKLNARTVFF
jgi:hypothetical protein